MVSDIEVLCVSIVRTRALKFKYFESLDFWSRGYYPICIILLFILTENIKVVVTGRRKTRKTTQKPDKIVRDLRLTDLNFKNPIDFFYSSSPVFD